MNITVICGCQRKNSKCEYLSRYMVQSLKAMRGIKPKILSFADNPFPFWKDPSCFDTKDWSKFWSPISEELRDSDGFSFVTPEPTANFATGVRNFFDLCHEHELDHKPCLVVSILSEYNKSLSLYEINSSTRMCIIPEQVVVKDTSFLSCDSDGDCVYVDDYISKKMNYSLQVLVEYTRALAAVRKHQAQVLEKEKAKTAASSKKKKSVSQKKSLYHNKSLYFFIYKINKDVKNL